MEESGLSTILVDKQRSSSIYYEEQMNNFLKEHEGELIVSDIQILKDMGYDKKMINKIYILLQPENIERAIDLMTQIDGIYQHNFFENHNKGKDKDLCFICKKPRRFHLDYNPDDLIENNFIEEFEDENNNQNINLIDNVNNNNIDKICNVCFDEVETEEINFNSLPCGHVCCTQCWVNYLKSLISEAKVEEIKCVEHKCSIIISDEFIMKHIKYDKKLVEKYNNFKKRAEIIKDPNKKQCPKPDCDSYLEKSNETNYVKCINGHTYCFECLNPPHGNISCEKLMEKEFMDWKKNKRVKRCPRCKIYTEKNEGCNHMTCTACKYQWCWLCEGQYSYGHYDQGKCKGFQFTKADNLEEAKEVGNSNNLLLFDFNDDLRPVHCCITLFACFPCYYERVERIRLFGIGERYIAIFIMWFLGVIGFAYLSFYEYFNRNDLDSRVGIFQYLIIFCLFICYQIISTCLITPFILISLVYPYFIDNIFKFLEMRV